MEDIFNVPLEVDDIVLWAAPGYDNTSMQVCKIKKIEGEVFKIVSKNSSYSYITTMAKSLININDKVHMIENFNNLVNKLDENDLEINDRILKVQQEKDEIKAKKNKLKKEMKPGDKFKAGGYSTFFIYLGVKDKQHIFCEFNRNYRYGRSQSEQDYIVSYTTSKFCQRMKSKKTPTEKFTEEIDFSKMLDEFETANTTNNRRYVNQELIDEVRELYNNIG